MQIPPEKLIDGAVRTLQESVLPSLRERFARGQLYAVMDVLQNLRDRIDEKASLHDAESESIAAALERIASLLREQSRAEDAAAIDAAVAAAPAGPASQRSAALRQAMNDALEALESVPLEVGDAARAILGEHFAAQAIRDVLVLKPSLLSEISKG